MGWGDCWAGCVYHRTWVFQVTENGASFVGALDD